MGWWSDNFGYTAVDQYYFGGLLPNGYSADQAAYDKAAVLLVSNNNPVTVIDAGLSGILPGGVPPSDEYGVFSQPAQAVEFVWDKAKDAADNVWDWAKDAAKVTLALALIGGTLLLSKDQ